LFSRRRNGDAVYCEDALGGRGNLQFWLALPLAAGDYLHNRVIARTHRGRGNLQFSFSPVAPALSMPVVSPVEPSNGCDGGLVSPQLYVGGYFLHDASIYVCHSCERRNPVFSFK
jgi:hypothetical protein